MYTHRRSHISTPDPPDADAGSIWSARREIPRGSLSASARAQRQIYLSTHRNTRVKKQLKGLDCKVLRCVRREGGRRSAGPAGEDLIRGTSAGSLVRPQCCSRARAGRSSRPRQKKTQGACASPRGCLCAASKFCAWGKGSGGPGGRPTAGRPSAKRRSPPPTSRRRPTTTPTSATARLRSVGATRSSKTTSPRLRGWTAASAHCEYPPKFRAVLDIKMN